MRTINFKKKIIEVLRNLGETYPNQPLSTHISLALSDFPNFDGISDKELFFILEKYRCEKELDITPVASDKEIQELYSDSIDEDIFDEDNY